MEQVRIEALSQLVEIQTMLDEQLHEAVRRLRSEEGGARTWREIGDSLGITRQAAQQRFGRVKDAPPGVGG
jgi:hypothetical protein